MRASEFCVAIWPSHRHKLPCILSSYFFWIFIWIFANKENFEIQDRIDRTAYKTRDRCKNHDSKENEVDQMMIYESLSFHIEHLSYNWSIITYWLLIKNSKTVEKF